MSTTPLDTCRSSPYFEWLRWDALAAVPVDAKRVLSVGCAAGLTEAELVKRGVQVVGVEIDPQAAQLARQRGVMVIEGDASVVDVNVGGEPYDCILYADILEHLSDPLSVLKRHVKSLRHHGVVYVSIPNFRHYSIFLELFVLGRVRYRDAGILDRTHLRITTRKMVSEWFHETGLDILGYHYSIPGRRNRLISVCLLGLGREFLANQIGMRGRKG